METEKQLLDPITAGYVAELFRAFSDMNRVKIISALIMDCFNVTQLAEVVGITESGISHHLRSLRQMRFIKSKRQGKEVYYWIDDEHIIALFQQGVNHVRQG